MKVLLMLLIFPLVIVAKPLEYYLPKGELYNATLPSPDVYFGQPLGERHLRHDQLVSYFKLLAVASDQAQLMQYGQTNEGRPLLLLAVSSRENIEQLETIKTKPNVLKIWNGFSIHGNESSGANASVLYAWYLLASNNNDIKKTLENTVILIDPSFNPDGLARFTSYVNSTRSITTIKDPNDISHNELWPDGRTNHYWFDLNRDWLLLTQAESKARVAIYQDWQPHVLSDHHEMWNPASFFFQPGVPSRVNPEITEQNQALTALIAKHHAKALDGIGQTYFSKEDYDDFYPGKGSTYPDLQGSIGILFEQARANGGVMKTHNGERSLAAGIRNQFLTALSTVYGAQANRHAILDYQNNFHRKAREQAKKSGLSGYLLDVSDNQYRAKQLMMFLTLHNIQFKNLSNDRKVKNHIFKKNQALFIPLDQKQTTLIQSLFNTVQHFKDNTFYDVSSWNLAMAWGLPFAPVSSAVDGNDLFDHFEVNNQYKKNALAYVFDWHSGNAAGALHYLTKLGLEIHMSGKPLHIDGIKVPSGSFILKADAQTEEQLFSTLSTITDVFQVKWYPVSTSLADQGIDMGSPAVKLLAQPSVLMVVGRDVDVYQAGSIWHLFDTQVFLPLTKVRWWQLNNIRLNDYSHIIIPNGDHKEHFNDTVQQKLKDWVKQGGTLIGLQKGAQFIEQKLQSKENKEQNDNTEQKEKGSERLAYGDYEKHQAERVLGGAIIAASADLSHPLAFGTKQETQYALLKGDSILKPSKDPFATPLQITQEIQAAGFVSDHWQEKLKNKPLVIAEKSGKGLFIKFGFNPTFRAFWKGTEQWLINAVFQSSLIKKTELSHRDTESETY